MVKQIKTILVPVDFSENTKVAISKALELCAQDQEHVTVHLYHVQRIVLHGFSYLVSWAFAGYSRQQLNRDIRESASRLEELKEEIVASRQNVRVYCSVSFGDAVQESIIKKALHLSADLVVVGKNSHHSLLTFLNTVLPSKIAALTRIPVLTAKRGSLHQEIKTVVIPVGNQFPGAKLEILSAFQNKSRPHIRLVIFPDDGSQLEDTKQLLLYTFRAFKSQFANPIHYEVLEGRNKAKTLLHYCNKVGADVLIVYPGSETQVGNWNKSHITDLLPAESKTQILAVRPA